MQTRTSKFNLMVEMPDNKSEILEHQMKNLRESYERVRTEIWGNGSDGLKTEVVKLRQGLKIATFVASSMLGLMIVDFYQSHAGATPGEVLEEVRSVKKSEARLEKSVNAILVKLGEDS